MKIFIDSADIGEIREAAAMGVIDGVTTNPSLVAKTGRSLQAVGARVVHDRRGSGRCALLRCGLGRCLAGFGADRSRTQLSTAEPSHGKPHD